MTDQQQHATPASDARLSAEQETEIRAFAASGNLFPPPVRRSSVTALLSELDTLRADLAASRAAVARLRAAGDAISGSVSELLNGGVEMKPAKSGPMTFEALVMLIQMLGSHRDAYRAAAATPPAPDEGAGSSDA